MSKVVAFSIADKNNMPYFEMMKNSFQKFHPDIPLLLWDEEKIKEYGDSNFFYRAKPRIARELIKQYELILALDCDQIIVGNLNHVINGDFDVATVLNWNRVDPQRFGEIGLATILPQEYYNCGFVAMRNKDFIEEWWRLCNGRHFQRMPFREQGFLNILTHYGNWNVTCLDYGGTANGLVSKGEWSRCIMRGDDMILPKNEDGYPPEDKIMKVIHFAGGNEAKMNYKIYFQEPVIKYIDSLIK